MKKSCLVVDDSKIVRKVARHILESLDFDVEEANDGRQALDRCERAGLDFILLDWNMPNMDGMEFLQALARNKQGQRPKILLCSTENAVGQIRTAIAEGADEYILKPFDRQALKAKLSMIGFC